jgi:hypothetical protein
MSNPYRTPAENEWKDPPKYATQFSFIVFVIASIICFIMAFVIRDFKYAAQLENLRNQINEKQERVIVKTEVEKQVIEKTVNVAEGECRDIQPQFINGVGTCPHTKHTMTILQPADTLNNAIIVCKCSR